MIQEPGQSVGEHSTELAAWEHIVQVMFWSFRNRSDGKSYTPIMFGFSCSYSVMEMLQWLGKLHSWIAFKGALGSVDIEVC
jgi:hypothetical protein